MYMIYIYLFIHSLKLTAKAPQKDGGWKTLLSFWDAAYFQGLPRSFRKDTYSYWSFPRTETPLGPSQLTAHAADSINKNIKTCDPVGVGFFLETPSVWVVVSNIFLFSTLFGEASHFDKWVETTN